MNAVREGSTEDVRLLLKASGIDANAASARNGHTALTLARRRGLFDIVNLLLAFPQSVVPSGIN
jgi:ankyrin repeat protein